MSVLETKLLREIAARRWQFAAIVMTVTIGVALFGASYDAYQNLLASYQELFDRTRFAALTVEGGDRHKVSAALAGSPGVAAIADRSTSDLPVAVGGTTFIGRLVGLPTARRAAVDDVLLLSGTYLEPADPSGVLVERHMADHFGLHAGSTLEIRAPDGPHQLTVRGVAASAEYIWPARSRQEILTLPDDFGVLFVPQPLLDTLPAAATTQQVLLTYSGPADDPGLTAALLARARAAGAVDGFTQAEQPSNAALQEDINGFGELSFLFPVMFLGAAGLAAYVLLSRLVLAQRAQIGLLLAVGFRRRRVFRHYLGFGIATGLLGAALGALAGAALAGVITSIYTGVIDIPVTVIQFRPLTVAAGLAFGLVAGAVAALAPARRAARLSPAVAMSGQVASGRGGESALEHLVPGLSQLPARWKMVVRGIGRAPVRSASTVLGVVIAVTLIFVSWGMLDTVEVLVERQFNDAQQADAVVYLTAPVSPADVQHLTAVSGVAAGEPLAELPVTISRDSRGYSTSIAAFPIDTTMHRFLTDGGSEPLPRDGILAGIGLKDRLGARAGDEVTLVFGTLGRTVRARLAGFVDEPLGTYLYTSSDGLSALLGPDAAASAARAVNVRFSGAADRSAVIAALRGVAGAAAVVDTRGLQRAAGSLLGLFYAFVGVMLVLGGLMAFALLFNLMSANIGERITELASLRASGMSGGQMSRIITAENVLLAVLGIVPGLVIGYLAAVEFMASFSSDLFQFDLHVRPTTFVFTAVGILVAALLSQLPILAAVRRIDIARVVRERAL